jgi:O-methyltransferase
MNSQALITKYPVISDQITKPALSVVLRELEHVLQRKIKGDIAEFGCYIGTTSVFIRRLLDETNESDHRLFYAYDSFEGLPTKVTADSSMSGEQFKTGELSVSKKQFLHTFQKARLAPPITHKGWFKDLRPEQMPDTLAFAFLDGDFYDSIMDSLRLAWPRVAPGGVITIDDYQREALPGVSAAVRDYFGTLPVSIRVEHNIGIVKKP